MLKIQYSEAELTQLKEAAEVYAASERSGADIITFAEACAKIRQGATRMYLGPGGDLLAFREETTFGTRPSKVISPILTFGGTRINPACRSAEAQEQRAATPCDFQYIPEGEPYCSTPPTEGCEGCAKLPPQYHTAKEHGERTCTNCGHPACRGSNDGQPCLSWKKK